MTRAWKVGERCWLIEGVDVFDDTVARVDTERNLIGIADVEEPNGVAWFDLGNAFAEKHDAEMQAAEWRVDRCLRGVDTAEAHLRMAEERLAALRAKGGKR